MYDSSVLKLIKIYKTNKIESYRDESNEIKSKVINDEYVEIWYDPDNIF